MSVEVLDLHFLEQPSLIASFLVRRGSEVALVESGPGSTLPHLTKALAVHGLSPSDVTHLFLTHIHLDHAGGAGWLAQQGATIYVHERGARHLINPERLLASATRVYGEDKMSVLWGDMLPVPEDKLVVLYNGDTVEAAGRTWTAIDTPGHAYHHLAYLTDEGDCFTGDVGGCGLPGYDHIRVPTPPPDFDLDAWRQSIARLQEHQPKRLFLTHFGERENASSHLERLRVNLDVLTEWMQEQWSLERSREEMIAGYWDWIAEQAKVDQVDEDGIHQYQFVAGATGCVDGYRRYFKKQQEQGE
ncbi:MAG: MBL fold metallo-hydrolase [Deltaproteobacteria bacterium]|nr:MAG: MBL fold metallo-hydrolase [Deltaproteobacteria bacterium]